MPKELVFLLPVIAAGIGWVTNYLAVKMLFHPRREVKVAGLRLHGVFPKRQKELAERLGEIVSEELFSIEEVTGKLGQMVASDDVSQLVADRIEQTIRNKLVKSFPMLSMFLSDDMVEKVTGLFLSDLKGMLGDVAGEIGAKLEEEIDVKVTVREKVAAFSTDKLEEMLFAIMKKEFRFIEVVGAVLGFLIGSVQVLLTWPY